ncbi:MAG: 16S rRNA (uracil(1498)-N(3))-methyltransferase [Paracoccaceae bacterium]
MKLSKIRLYVDHPLSQGQSVPLNKDQGNYLFSVMRRAVGDGVLLFNGRDGEFSAEVTVASRQNGVLVCVAKTRPIVRPPDLWFLFAPIKKARTDFIVEKATEMGASKIVPVQTEYTNNARIRRDKLQAHAIEAAEQCGGTYVPEVANIQTLRATIQNWPQERRLMFCDEDLVGAKEKLQSATPGPWAILIGPEGGFSSPERELLRQMEQSVSVSLGPRILRADTAAVAALTIWQSSLGDW